MHADENLTVKEALELYGGLRADEHGEDTPSRFLNALDEMTCCRSKGSLEDDLRHLKGCIKWKTFKAESDDMIILEKMPFVSVCNHHLAAFIGYAYIGYVPKDRIAGLSKFSRTVQHFARQLQLQERLTQQVTDFLLQKLEPRGLAVMIRAEHTCMTIRGAQSPGTLTTTTQMKGVFGDHDRTAKMEFMQTIALGK